MTHSSFTTALSRTRMGLFGATAALSLALTSSAVMAQETKALAKVGDVTITQADLDQALKDLTSQFANFPEAQRKARALDALIDIQVLAQKARENKLDQEAETKRRLALLSARALHNAWFQNKIQPSITDEAMKARYEKELANTPAEEEVSARHILVKTEEEARTIIKELDGGADFVELAKTKSTGPSGPKGGDLGFFTKGRMVPEFEAAAFSIEKGAYTKEPVKTQFGYHIIKVDEKRSKPLPTLEQSKNQLRQVMLAEAYAKAVKTAREEAGTTVLEESLKLPEAN